ncbi:ASCH domain-containing protein [Gracilimonas tropica]|uniref:ASCH domain-containing protein n=1 Tax=Gracilimonas tropica TaxID=454600 RepID=UPI0003729E17|nr:ASCH domain-containing protein [Gracilimonas tropica]
MNNFLFISVKPDYSHKIFSGEKKIELRKSSPNVNEGDVVVIYSTNPDKLIIGYCKVVEVIKTTPELMWQEHATVLGIEKKDFDEYYDSVDLAVGIKLGSVSKLKEAISLKSIKEVYPSFHPPQTFKYFSRQKVLTVYSKIAF